MAVEVQKLITVSLGKIAASRQQRGGPSLHRSLLVSTVLHKARTTYMMENFHAMMVRRQAEQALGQTSEQGQCEAPVMIRPGQESSSPAAPASTPGNPESPAKRARTEPRKTPQDDDKENSPPPPKKDCQDSQVMSNKLVISEKQNKSDENDSVITKDCAKCVKRRLTDARDPNESSQAKRAKSCDSENKCDSNVNVEPMQTQDSQISSLVQRFNSGLSNFLGSNSGHMSAKSGKHAESDMDRLNGQGQGHADSIKPSSCSTQMKNLVTKPKDSFVDTLSRPVIALTV